LRELRVSKGETQKQLSALLGIAERNYRRYEAGEVDPTASKLILLADYFNVSVDYLIGQVTLNIINP